MAGFRTAHSGPLKVDGNGPEVLERQECLNLIRTAAGTGWSVAIVGHARAIRDPAEIRRLSLLPVHPWSPGPHEHFIRIRGRHMSGRRITPPA